MKKSFILYMDVLNVLDMLTDEQAGRLFKAIRQYQLGETPELEPLLNIALFQFKTHFERDGEKYENVIERNKENGKKGGRPKTQNNPNNPAGFSKTQNNPKEPKKPDNDNDNVSDNVSEKDNDKQFIEFWELYHAETKKGKEDKDRTLKHWKKLTKAEKQKAIESIKPYAESKKGTDIQYIKKAVTFISSKAFNDEINPAKNQRITEKLKDAQGRCIARTEIENYPVVDAYYRKSDGFLVEKTNRFTYVNHQKIMS